MPKAKAKPSVAPKPKRGVGQVISRRRRDIANRQHFRDVEREAAERELTHKIMSEQAARAADRIDPVIVQRVTAANHALNVLASDHRAYMSAIGHPHIEVITSLHTKNFLDPRRTHTFGKPKDEEVVAYTDFAKIVVTLPAPPLSRALRDWVTEVRGILHHEAGHVRFTTPFTELCLKATGQSSDHLANSRSIHMAWNALEDQRMECAVVRATPRIQNYFIPMVLNVVLEAKLPSEHYAMDTVQQNAVRRLAPWLALAGRSYFSDEVRAQAKRDFDTFGHHFGLSSDVWLDIVSRYVSATDEATMFQAVLDAKDFISKISEDTKTGNGTPTNDDDIDWSKSQTRENIFRKITNPDEQHDAMRGARSNAPLEDSASEVTEPKESVNEGGDGDDEVDGEDVGNGDSASRGVADNVIDQMKKEAERASQQLAESAEVDDLMSRINDRVGSGAIPVEGALQHSRAMRDDHVAEARVLSFSIQDALEAFRTEKSPVWARRQEQGYLDPLEYRTREAGEATYHVEPQNWDNSGLGIHVSFLADRSGSMSQDMVPLSQTLWAVKTACNSLGIPSTMVMWADTAETARVMEDNAEPVVFNSRGGTYPIVALDDLESHVDDNNLHHLVFIFTDGEWSSVTSLSDWQDANRTFVIIGLNCKEQISSKGADVIIPISSIRELGSHVKNILEERVAAL
jgi:hypothetical protein